MLVDANLLIYAVDTTSPFHARAHTWLTERLNGPRRVGIPWESLTAFLRLTTNPRVLSRPLTAAESWRLVRAWLDSDVAWIPQPTSAHAGVLEQLLLRHHLTGALVADAHLAALAVQHGLTVCSADSDFARFPEIVWRNPLTE
jgi:toxin-antitoxin system PIN domain toxin